MIKSFFGHFKLKKRPSTLVSQITDPVCLFFFGFFSLPVHLIWDCTFNLFLKLCQFLIKFCSNCYIWNTGSSEKYAACMFKRICTINVFQEKLQLVCLFRTMGYSGHQSTFSWQIIRLFSQIFFWQISQGFFSSQFL